MGVKIQKAFDTIMEVASLAERMAVSMKATIPSAKASSVPDDLKNLTLMRQAVNEVFAATTNIEIKARKQDVLEALQ